MSLKHYALPLVAALVCSAVMPREVHAQAAKVAVVDLQRAINETEDGRKSKDRLKKLFESRQQGLDKKQQDLKKLKDELDTQKNVLSREALEAKVESYQKQLTDLQQIYVEYQRELAEKEGELTKSIVARMEVILRRIGQSEGYSLILERGEAGVIFVPTNLDLTDVVIQRYNAGEGADPAAAGKPAAGAKPAAAGAKPAPAKPAAAPAAAPAAPK
ncbi:MAG: outer membrane protein precursor [Myxococcaceae bacterium]|nr:outer membrane protein precursor [Myxococcaceae bacterium]